MKTIKINVFIAIFFFVVSNSVLANCNSVPVNKILLEENIIGFSLNISDDLCKPDKQAYVSSFMQLLQDQANDYRVLLLDFVDKTTITESGHIAETFNTEIVKFGLHSIVIDGQYYVYKQQYTMSDLQRGESKIVHVANQTKFISSKLSS